MYKWCIDIENMSEIKNQGEDNEHNNISPEKELLEAKHEKANVEKKGTFFQNVKQIKSNITVEPILAGIIISSMISKLAVQNLNLDKACRVKLTLGDVICDSLIDRTGVNLTQHERDVQRIIASIETWRSIIQTAVPIVLVILMGAWSDRTGNRRLCILLPILGEFLVCVGNLISTFFFYQIPVEVTMFLEVIFPAVTGGWTMVFMGVFSYISDITSEEYRTFRVGLVNLCLTAGIPIGTALSGILLKLLGYYGVFSISGMIYLLTFLYGYLKIKKNTKQKVDEDEKNKPFKFTDITSLVKETAVVAFRKREGIARMKILLTLLVVAVIYGPGQGERIVIYLYVRYRLKWDAVKYSMYSTYSIITHSMSALFSISVFSRRWGFHDSMLCFISVSSKLAGSLWLAFVTTDFDMFMVPLVEILNATTFTSLRSMASKLVDQKEMGKMNSLFSLVETMAAMVFDPIYSGLYFATLPVLPGAVFLFSGAMAVPAVALLLWFFAQHRRELRQSRKEAAVEGPEVAEGITEIGLI